MKSKPLILAIDTSCDDTAAAVTQGTRILSNIVASQTELHKQYGGVFPTVAKLAHRENIGPVVDFALRKAGVTAKQLDALAVTQGPGLAPALEVGIKRALELSEKWQLPLLPINHLEGHLLSVLAQPKTRHQLIQPKLPALGVIVSGGHTEFVLVKKIGQYKIFGSSMDDAAGECLDKIGRMLNLGYPAGPVIEQFAKHGNPLAIEFPLPLTQIKSYDLSFSGLKTYARNKLEAIRTDHQLSKQETYDFCASIQYAVFKHIQYKLNKLLENVEIEEVWLGGGVAANINLRVSLRVALKSYKLKLRVPYSKKLCADNAAMIGIAAGFKPLRKSNKKIERQPRLEL